jgi:hypothetical protein
MNVSMRTAGTTAGFGLALLGALFAESRVSAGGPEMPQHQIVVLSDVQVLQNKVADLEKRLAALQQQFGAAQQQFAAHTHNYMPPRCNAFMNLATFRNVLNNPATEPGMGICLVQPGGNLVATGAPNK